MSHPLRFFPRPCLALLLTIFVWFGGARSAHSEVTTRLLAPGITLTQEITAGDAPLIINVLHVDPSVPGVRVRCGQAQDAITLNGSSKGREPLHAIASRQKALAAVNADFFPFTGDPLGLAIRDGELLSEPMEYRASFGLGPNGADIAVLVPVGALTLADGSSMALNGINRVPHDGEVVALTPSYAAAPRLKKPCVVVTLRDVNLPVRVSQAMRGIVELVTPVTEETPLPLCPAGGVLLVAVGSVGDSLGARSRLGDALEFRFDLARNDPPPMRGRFPSRAGAFRGRSFSPAWTDVEQAVGGGPMLLRDGQVAIDHEAEGFAKASFVEKRHPRTAVGVTADGKLLFVTVDGRQEGSRGASLGEMANLLKRLGAVNALNLDGGGSTTMTVGSSVVNAPSDGRERSIANSLLIYGTPAELPDAETLEVRPNAPDGVTVRVGEPLTFSLTDAEGRPAGAEKTALWGTSDGFGFISQRGVFVSYRVGMGTVLASIEGKQIAVPVRVLGGTAAQIKASLGPVANNPPDRHALNVRLLDKYGNPVAGQHITVTVQGGEVLSPLITDEKGQAVSEVVWDALPGSRRLTVFVTGVAPVTLRK